MFIDNDITGELNSIDAIEKAIIQNKPKSTTSEIDIETKKLDIKDLLNNLLKLVKPVNFREHANLENEKDKLQKRHYLVSTIEIIIDIANKYTNRRQINNHHTAMNFYGFTCDHSITSKSSPY